MAAVCSHVPHVGVGTQRSIEKDAKTPEVFVNEAETSFTTFLYFAVGCDVSDLMDGCIFRFM